jgi:hypothetical protein
MVLALPRRRSEAGASPILTNLPLPSRRALAALAVAALLLLLASAVRQQHRPSATHVVVRRPPPRPHPQPRTHDTSLDGATDRLARVEAAAASGADALPDPPTAYAHSIALCTVVRDQGPDLAEWVAWHARLGVSKMYVYDHGSHPPLSFWLQQEMAAGLVEVVDHAGGGTNHPSLKAQMAGYDACAADHRGDAEWLAFIDVDEFFVLTGDGGEEGEEEGEGGGDRDNHHAHHPPSFATAPAPDLPTLLARYPHAGALVVHWRVFGSGGWRDRPPAGVLASFDACLPAADHDNRHVKTIARTAALACIEPCLGPHHFAYRAGWFAVDARGRRMDGPVSLRDPVHVPIALHHYAIKSTAEFEAKAARGSGMGNHKSPAFAAGVDARATATCGGVARVARAAGFADVFGR